MSGIEGKTIFLFWFMDDWGRYGRAYEKIAQALARIPEVGRVVCAFPPVDVPPRLPLIEVRQWEEKLLVVRQKKGLLDSDARPFRIRQAVNRWSSRLILQWMVRKLALRAEETILWLFPPHRFISTVLSVVPHRFLVTQVVDNNTLLDGLDEKYVRFAIEQYRRVAEASDAVITSSRTNHRMFSAINRKCGYFENAVDSAFIGEPTPLPHQLNPGSRPKLGYLGFISERTDLGLLRHVAVTKPGYDICIAGPVAARSKEEHQQLVALPNVHYRGIVPYEEVPRFLQEMDLCLIPHKDTPYSQSMSPLKLFQYLGSGKPVVSTAVAGVERFRDVVSVAADPVEFVGAIEQNLTNDTVLLSQRRIAVARNETWDKRVGDIYRFVAAAISVDHCREARTVNGA